MSQHLSDQELVRREALQKLRALGIDPFPAAEYPVSHTAAQARLLLPPPQEGVEAPKPEVCIAGRIMSVRLMGKASFAVLRDHTEIGRASCRERVCLYV